MLIMRAVSQLEDKEIKRARGRERKQISTAVYQAKIGLAFDGAAKTVELIGQSIII